MSGKFVINNNTTPHTVNEEPDTIIGVAVFLCSLEESLHDEGVLADGGDGGKEIAVS